MDKKILHRIMDIQNQVTKDEEYLYQLALFRDSNDRLLTLLPQMTEAQQQTVMDMIYYGANLHWRILAIACGDDVKTAPQ